MSRESPVFFGFWVPLSSLYVLFSAADYIDCLMTWVESQLDDEDIFPINTSNFPKNFEKVVKTIFRRMFRVYAHLYHHHFQQIEKGAGDVQLNTSFKHFILYALHFELIPKEELGPLDDLIQHLLERGKKSKDEQKESKQNGNESSKS
mmetsp:Transcript_6782/g.12584  ORF Transcript_6782/g.12584 Transcript_6782/m.12584 type:complete len:148 (-) Transcript_6782:149-592(-)